MLDLNTIDPATIPASPELDALIAEKWMGWKRLTLNGIATEFWEAGTSQSELRHTSKWSPSTNPAHAGEARRKAEWWTLETDQVDDDRKPCIICQIGKGVLDSCQGLVLLSETNGDKGRAEALATCRAIVEALMAAETAGGE